MSRFDKTALFQSSVDEVLKVARPSLLDAIMSKPELRDALEELKADTERLMEAVERETDPARLAGLQRDLESSVRSRRSSLVSRSKSLVGSDSQAALDEGLKLLGQILVATARAFVAR